MVEKSKNNDALDAQHPGYRDIDTGRVAVWGALGSLLILAIVVATQGFYVWLQDEDRSTKRDLSGRARAFRAEEQAHLRTYGWLSKAEGKVHIPLQQAMGLFLQEAKQDDTK